MTPAEKIFIMNQIKSTNRLLQGISTALSAITGNKETPISITNQVIQLKRALRILSHV